MSLVEVLAECEARGVSLTLVGDGLAVNGTQEAIDACRPLLKQNKADLIAHLSAAGEIDLVAEFMEVDGLTREEAEAIALISVQPRSPGAWTALLAELDDAIEAYCVAYSLPEAQKELIRGARSRQSVATLRETLDWFYGQLDIAALDAHQRASQGRGTGQSLAA